ncbi:MAG: LexA repressor [Chlamydiales bacterium]|nr:LexA repressor [Chlamydiales bacterium]
MQGLTKRQQEIIEFIESYVSTNRYSPSYREIQEHFGFSSLGSVYNHIHSLKKKGKLPENTQQARSLQVLCSQKSGGIEIPLIGRLKGGMPIETFAQISFVTLPSYMSSQNGDCYLLKIVGSELEEEWIKEGDLLLVLPRTEFVDGELIIAQVGGQTTFVKRGFLDAPYIRLESDNSEVQPLILREDHIQVLGVVLSLLRNY